MNSSSEMKWYSFLQWSIGRLQHMSGKRNVNFCAPKCRCKHAATWRQSLGTWKMWISVIYDKHRYFHVQCIEYMYIYVYTQERLCDIQYCRCWNLVAHLINPSPVFVPEALRIWFIYLLMVLLGNPGTLFCNWRHDRHAPEQMTIGKVIPFQSRFHSFHPTTDIKPTSNFDIHPWNLTWNLKRGVPGKGDSELGNHHFQVPC